MGTDLKNQLYLQVGMTTFTNVIPSNEPADTTAYSGIFFVEIFKTIQKPHYTLCISQKYQRLLRNYFFLPCILERFSIFFRFFRLFGK